MPNAGTAGSGRMHTIPSGSILTKAIAVMETVKRSASAGGGEIDRQRGEGTWGSGDSLTLDGCPYAFVQTHRMCDAKREP